MGVDVQLTCRHSKQNYARILTSNRVNSRRVCHSTSFSWSTAQNPAEIPWSPTLSCLWSLLLLSRRADLTSHHPTSFEPSGHFLHTLGFKRCLIFHRNKRFCGSGAGSVNTVVEQRQRKITAHKELICKAPWTRLGV